MLQEHLDILRAAHKGLRKDEELEQSVGREVRRRGLPFETYLGIMAEVRDIARSEKVSNDRAARILLQQRVDNP